MKKFNSKNLIVLAIEMLCIYAVWTNTPAPGYGQVLLDKPTTSSLSLDDDNNKQCSHWPLYYRKDLYLPVRADIIL